MAQQFFFGHNIFTTILEVIFKLRKSLSTRKRDAPPVLFVRFVGGRELDWLTVGSVQVGPPPGLGPGAQVAGVDAPIGCQQPFEGGEYRSIVRLCIVGIAARFGALELRAERVGPLYAKQKAFYYARVIEIPTPRWSTYDAFRFGIELPKDVPTSTQERAYTSPIWYTPKA